MVTTRAQSKALAADKIQQQTSNQAITAVEETSHGVSGAHKANEIGDGAMETFPLFDLPPELWIRICRLAATTEDKITFRNADFEYESQHDLYQPAITRTCKAIRNETLHWFYSSNNFLLYYLDWKMISLYKWLEAIGPANRKSLNTIWIHAFLDTEYHEGSVISRLSDLSKHGLGIMTGAKQSKPGVQFVVRDFESKKTRSNDGSGVWYERENRRYYEIGIRGGGEEEREFTQPTTRARRGSSGSWRI